MDDLLDGGKGVGHAEVDPACSQPQTHWKPGKTKQRLQTPSGHNLSEHSTSLGGVVIGSLPFAKMVPVQLSHLTSQ